MKKIFNSTLLTLLAAFLFVSCKKLENQVVFEGGTAPVLSANSTDTLPLSLITKDQDAVTLSWTNPSYKFNTGVSSQDVNYAIEIRKTGTTAFKTYKVVGKVNSVALNQGDLDKFLVNSIADGGLNLTPDSLVSLDVRVTSFLGTQSSTNATNLSSNILTFRKVRPYSQDPLLYITGEAVASGWTNNPPASQKFTYNRATGKHSITIALTGGLYYKFLTVPGAWQPQWGVPNTTTVTTVLGQEFPLAVNPGGGTDPEAIKAPAASRSYTITVDLVNKTAVVN